MQPFQIKNGTLENIPRLADLLADLFRLEPDFMINRGAQEAGLALVLKNPVGIIKTAWQGETLIGMASGQIVYSTSEGAPSVWVEDVIVDKKFRSQGVGPLLLASVEAWGLSHGAHRFQLVAEKNNAEALAFYQKKGWKKTSLIVLRKTH